MLFKYLNMVLKSAHVDSSEIDEKGTSSSSRFIRSTSSAHSSARNSARNSLIEEKRKKTTTSGS